MSHSEYNLIVVLGPTASGKTSFAARLALAVNGEMISADSRQVYRRMNIGTGKDYGDYIIDDVRIPAHLIDIADPGYKYSIFEYQRDFFRAFNQVTSNGRFPVLCGGSGMYIEAATKQYRLQQVPENEELREKYGSASLEVLTALLEKRKKLHNKTDADTVERALRALEIEEFNQNHPPDKEGLPAINALYLGILYDRQEERKRISERLDQRLKEGMIDEVRDLMASGISSDSLIYYGLEYRFITLFLTGKMDYPSMKKNLNTAIHQFAKRQRTWFRKMEREGCRIHWLNGEWPMETKLSRALELLKC